MKAFFADIEETGLVPDRGPRPGARSSALPTDEQRARQERTGSQADSTAQEQAGAETGALARAPGGMGEGGSRRAMTRAQLDWKYQRPISAEVHAMAPS